MNKLKYVFYKSFFYLLVTFMFLLCFLLLVNFEKISLNVFSLNYMFNVDANPFYQLTFGLLVIIVFTFFLYTFKNRFYFNVWIIKLFVTIFIVGLFEYLYVGIDQFGYAVNAIYDYNKLPFFQSGNGFIIGVNHIFTYFVGNSFYSLKFVNSIIAFLSLILFYKTYKYILEKENIVDIPYLRAYCLFISPTVLFWSSLIGKDSLILFPISLFVYSCLKFLDKKSLFYFLMIIFSLILAYYIRRWIPLIMIGTLFFYNISFNKKKIFLLFIFSLILFILAGFILKTLNTDINGIFTYLGNLSKSFSRGNTAVEVNTIIDFWDYCIYYFPNAFTALFLPLPGWGTSNVFLWVFSFENLFILFLFIIYVLFNIQMVFYNKYLKFLFLFLFSWSLVYVILSPGNLSTAIRYKSQIWTILIMMILISLELKKSYKNNN